MESPGKFYLISFLKEYNVRVFSPDIEQYCVATPTALS